MRAKISELERIARQLEPSADQRQEMLSKVNRYADRFLDELPQLPVYVPGQPDPRFGEDFSDDPAGVDDLLEDIAR